MLLLNEEKTEMYYCTFGVGTVLEKYYQPIIARTQFAAERLMFKHYKNKWCSVYTEKEFSNVRKEGKFVDLKPLKAKSTFDTITTGEMQQWQERLLDIIETTGDMKLGRLRALELDVLMRGKRLTLKEKKHLSELKLDPADWLTYRKNDSEWIIFHTQTKEKRQIKKSH